MIMVSNSDFELAVECLEDYIRQPPPPTLKEQNKVRRCKVMLKRLKKKLYER